tara:strand:+ start:97 stop:408 length:312 start_codon:yes stop_codon:yes gene_type:complete
MKTDIINRIESDFRENSNKAKEIITNRVGTFEHLLKNDRIIRCIIYLSKGSIKELNHFVDIALQDPRDVMMLAEYKEGSNFENFKRLRDFNKTFEECEKNVKE